MIPAPHSAHSHQGTATGNRKDHHHMAKTVPTTVADALKAGLTRPGKATKAKATDGRVFVPNGTIEVLEDGRIVAVLPERVMLNDAGRPTPLRDPKTREPIPGTVSSFSLGTVQSRRTLDSGPMKGWRWLVQSHVSLLPPTKGDATE